MRQNVASCDVLLVIIGPQWASIVDANGNKRLFDESDYVRYEVDTALRIPKIKVIPILINGAEMPAAADLPRVLQPIANLNAAIIRNDPDFQGDMDKLVGLLNPRRSPYLTWVAIAVALIVVGLIAFAPRLFSTAAPTATPTLSPSPVPPTDTNTPMPTVYIPPTGTATQSVQLDITATEIMLQRTVDAKQTANAVLMAESTHLAETAKAVPTSTTVPSDTPKPSVTPIPPSPTAIPSTPIPDTATPANGQLHVFATRESLTLYVTQAVSLLGFQFGIIVDGNLQLKSLKDSFDVLTLSGGQANINDCYVYVIDGASPPLSQSCKGQVFRTTVAAADVFWYDSVANQPRNLAIFRDGQTTGIICSAAAPDCGVTWDFSPTSTNTPPPTLILLPSVTPIPASATMAVKSYPCDATIVSSGDASLLNKVHSEPSETSSFRDPITVGSGVKIKERSGNTASNTWYRIITAEEKPIGWIRSEYISLSQSCP